MTTIRAAAPLAALAFVASATCAAALTPDEIETARFDGAPPTVEGPSALMVKVQLLLDAAHISPGVIDGYAGGMSETAIMAFERREGLVPDGLLDADVWAALGGEVATGLTTLHTITEDDLAAVTGPLPEDYAELAELPLLGYASALEALAEKFHMDVDLLALLNPGAAFAPGESINAVLPRAPAAAPVARISVNKSTGRLTASDAEGIVVSDYPVTVGSDGTPSPSGVMEVLGVALDPSYSYDPKKNFQQGDNTEFLELPPGPNGPVGSVWIDLSEPTYGLHGTPEPAKLFTRQSHGCVRMTNWDARELAGLVEPGVVVEFVE